MAFLRKRSPFINAHLNYPKKEETIFDIQISSTSTSHNSIECGTNTFAFQAAPDQGRLAVLPLDTKGRISYNDLSHIFISNVPLTDFKFLRYPSDKDILVTTTRAGNVKLFTLKEITDGPKSINSPDREFNTSLGAVETLASHKSVSNFFAIGGEQGWGAFDAESCGQIVVGGAVNGAIKAMDWNTDGNQVALLHTTDKNRMSTAIDARSNDVILEYEAHSSFGRESRIIYGGKYIISSGFNQSRFQEIVIYDTVAKKIFMRQQYDKSISFLIPAYDEDTKLLFLGAKGSTLIRHVDITNMDIASPNQLNCPTQTIGFCLSPKLKCDVMSAEVQKVYQLHSGGVAPIPCKVIRRSYIEFHDELYPETAGKESGGTVKDWKNGTDQPVGKINLRPADAPVIGYIGATSTSNKVIESAPNLTKNSNTATSQSTENTKIIKTSTVVKTEPQNVAKNKGEAETSSIRKTATKTEEVTVKLREAPPPRPSSHNASSQVSTRMYESRSPYYNIKAETSKSKTITEVRDVNSRISSDGIFFTASGKYAAVAMSKIEGSVAIYDLDVSGRTPDGSMDAIFNKAPIMDLQFDPFCETKILCVLSNGIKLWDISESNYCTNKVPEKKQPEPGMRNVITEENIKHLTLSRLTPVVDIRCQVPKVVIARYNPAVENIVAVAGSNGAVIIINLGNGDELFKTNHHKSAIVSLSWSSDGTKLISVDRDSLFVLSDIRKENDGVVATMEFKTKSPRAIFAGQIENEFVFVNYLHGTLHKWMLLDLTLNPIKEGDYGSSQGSQSIRPFYDYDTGIIMMSAKSSPNIFMLHVTCDGLVQDILQTTLANPHQAIALLPKNIVDPAVIEIIRVIRLTNNSIEVIPFIVPRREKNLFLRELYPNALITWEPSMKVDEWLTFKHSARRFCDLKPDNMAELPFERYQTSSSKHNSEKTLNLAIKTHSLETDEKPLVNTLSMKSSDHKKTEAAVMQGWSNAIPVDKEAKIPQDEFEGAGDDEWEEICVEEQV